MKISYFGIMMVFTLDLFFYMYAMASGVTSTFPILDLLANPSFSTLIHVFVTNWASFAIIGGLILVFLLMSLGLNPLGANPLSSGNPFNTMYIPLIITVSILIVLFALPDFSILCPVGSCTVGGPLWLVTNIFKMFIGLIFIMSIFDIFGGKPSV